VTAPAVTVGGRSIPQEIANCFASKFGSIYNGYASVETLPTTQVFGPISYVDSGVIREAIGDLKRGKIDGVFPDLSSDCLVNGTDLLFNHLSVLFNICITHGYLPSEVCNVVFKPILKPGRPDRSNVDNYRGIAYGSVFFKLFEVIFLKKFAHLLYTGHHQFGFKKGLSAVVCTWTVKEVICYFLSRCSLVYACFLDCSKAFDLVNHDILFCQLKRRGVDGLYLRLLRFCYSNQRGRVQWGGSFSAFFEISNGVRQGGILSPYLFGIYIDGISDYVRSCRAGCHVNSFYYGVLVYADDIVLLAPSMRGLMNMLDHALKFTNELYLHFNPSKSFCVRFGHTYFTSNSVKIGNSVLPWVSHVRHLGSVLSFDMDDGHHIDHILQDFYARANVVISRFRYLSPNILLYLFQSYATCYFGIVACDLSHGRLAKLITGWNKCIRRIFGLPFTTHTHLLSPIICKPHVSQAIHGRFLKFAFLAINSSNGLVFSIANLTYCKQTSRFGKNLCHVLCLYNVEDVYQFIRYNRRDLNSLFRKVQAISSNFRAGFIRDILLALHGGHADGGLLTEILQYLCCH
jgi:hypothetical protein